MAQDRVGAGKAGLDADLTRQPRDSLEVVREHIGAGRKHHIHRAGVTLEVAGQHLEDELRSRAFDGANRRRPVRGAAVLQIVPIHAGDHGVPQAELGQNGRDALRLTRVGGLRPARGHVAKLTGTGAGPPQNHDGERFAVPALADVGARCAFADGVQAELGDPLAQVEEGVAGRHLRANPGRFGGNPGGGAQHGSQIFWRKASVLQNPQLTRPRLHNTFRHPQNLAATTKTLHLRLEVGKLDPDGAGADDDHRPWRLGQDHGLPGRNLRPRPSR